MFSVRARRAWATIFTVVLAVSGLAAFGLTTSVAHADEVVGDGGQFVPVPAYRLVDTTTGVGGSSLRLGDGQSRDYQILGIGGVPATGVSAVVVDVAAVSLIDAATSTLRVYPTGGAFPDNTVLRFEEGVRPRSNTVVTKVSSDGKIRVYNADGAANFNLDVQGYFTTSVDGSGFKPIAPVRMVGTSTGTGVPQAEISGGTTYDIAIAGTEVVPTGATAIFANVKISGAEINGGLRLSEGGVASSAPATINYQAGVWSDSGMTIKLSSEGTLRLTNVTAGSTVAVHIDVQGYFLPSEQTEGGFFTALSGTRIYDSQNSTPIPAGATRTVPIASLGGLPAADSIGAAMLTVFASDWSASGSIKVYAADVPEPSTSNVSFNNSSNSAWGLSSTGVTAVSADGMVKITNTSTASVRVILNAQGWFSRAPMDPVIQQLLAFDPTATEVDVIAGINELVVASAQDPEMPAPLTFDQAKVAFLEMMTASVAEVDEMIEQTAEDIAAGAPAVVDYGTVTGEDPDDGVVPAGAQVGSPPVYASSPGGSTGGTRIRLPAAKRYGDIVVAPNKSHYLPHGHAAIFTGKNYLAQAVAGDQRLMVVHRLDPWGKVFAPGAKMMSVFTDEGNGPLLSFEKRNKAGQWALNRAGDRYRGFTSPNAFRVTGSVGSDGSKQNCSQVVWGAYNYANGYDFNPIQFWQPNSTKMIDRSFVLPGELIDAPQTIVYRTVNQDTTS